MRSLARFVVVSVVLACTAACRGPVRPYEAVAQHVENLRARFNSDAGAVRILILPAPT